MRRHPLSCPSAAAERHMAGIEEENTNLCRKTAINFLTANGYSLNAAIEHAETCDDGSVGCPVCPFVKPDYRCVYCGGHELKFLYWSIYRDVPHAPVLSLAHYCPSCQLPTFIQKYQDECHRCGHTWWIEDLSYLYNNCPACDNRQCCKCGGYGEVDAPADDYALYMPCYHCSKTGYCDCAAHKPLMNWIDSGPNDTIDPRWFKASIKSDVMFYDELTPVLVAVNPIDARKYVVNMFDRFVGEPITSKTEYYVLHPWVDPSTRKPVKDEDEFTLF